MTDLSPDKREISPEYLADVEAHELMLGNLRDIQGALDRMGPDDWANDKTYPVELNLIPPTHRERPGKPVDAPVVSQRTIATGLDLLHAELEGGDRYPAPQTDENVTYQYWAGKIPYGKNTARDVYIEERTFTDDNGQPWLNARAHLKMPESFAKLLEQQRRKQANTAYEIEQAKKQKPPTRAQRLAQRIGKASAAYLENLTNPPQPPHL